MRIFMGLLKLTQKCPNFCINFSSATRRLRLPKKDEYERTQLGDSVDMASMKILKEAFWSAEDKNVISSPLGALTLLSLCSAGIEGKGRKEITNLLLGKSSSDYKQLEQSYSNLSERFSSMDPSYLVLANKMYVSDKYVLNDQFSNTARQSYKSEVEQVDFAQKQSTADSINKWADEKTKGLIKNPVDDKTIDEDSAVVLFNIIFFQGHWHVPFKASDTEEKDFFVDANQTLKKPMMKLQRSMFYYEDKKIRAKMVELPYKEAGFRMVVVLPNEKDGLPDVVKKLSKSGILEDVFKLKSIDREIAFEMPKFEIKSSLNLNNILEKVGVSGIFSEGAHGIVRDQPVKVSKVFQEAFVKVDEEGATAGAFTGCIVIEVSDHYEPPPPLEFKVDHPFLFVILHEDIVLFTGTYTH